MSVFKDKEPADQFTKKVASLIIAIPQGKVATYGQIAELAGKPNGSRQVGFILRTILDSDKVPWQRVIGAMGRIAFPKRNKHFKLQKKLLEKEGVVFDGERVNLDKYRWEKWPKGPSGRKQPRMFSW